MHPLVVCTYYVLPSRNLLQWSFMSDPSQLRRDFFRQSCLLAGAVALGRRVSAQTGAETYDAKLTITGGSTGQMVAADFIGLSYENMQLEDPMFFSPANRGLVEQFRNLSRRGVLRLGGNTSEFAWWKANNTDRPPDRNLALKDGSRPASYIFAITPETIRQLDKRVSTGHRLELYLRPESGLRHSGSGYSRGAVRIQCTWASAPVLSRSVMKWTASSTIGCASQRSGTRTVTSMNGW